MPKLPLLYIRKSKNLSKKIKAVYYLAVGLK
jgi:hypothetical protein